MKNTFLGFACFSMMAVLPSTSCKQDNTTKATVEVIAPSDEPKIKTNILLTNQEIIWGMDFLPNGDLLFTEKKGKIYRFSGGKVTELSGVPNNIFSDGQGGLLDIRVHPNYASNGWIYASFNSLGAGKATQLNLVRFKLQGNALTNLETVFTTEASNTWYGHNGSRIDFDDKGFLYLSVGEGGSTSYGGEGSANKNAQNTKVAWGKVHRMTDSGQVPSDNPILEGNIAPSTIYSYGHRNPQGLIFNPTTKEMWEAEHGPRGGDEVNIIQKGKNYGWPLVSYGINYDGKTIAKNPILEGTVAPIHQYTPSIGTCGIAFITSDKFKAWKGNLLVGGLAYQYLSRLEVNGNKIGKEHKMFENIGRVRNVKQGPDGNIYISVENPGRIIQIIPE